MCFFARLSFAGASEFKRKVSGKIEETERNRGTICRVMRLKKQKESLRTKIKETYKVKKGLLTCIAIVMAGLLTACGGSKTEQNAVDLNTFYNDLAQLYEWDDGYMMEIEEDMLDSYYPGLKDIPKKQFIARTPMITAAVCEIILTEVENPEDANAVEEILKARVKERAEGGAWYPASMEAWSRAEVIRNGNFIALIASSTDQDAIEGAFNQLFESK